NTHLWVRSRWPGEWPTMRRTSLVLVLRPSSHAHPAAVRPHHARPIGGFRRGRIPNFGYGLDRRSDGGQCGTSLVPSSFVSCASCRCTTHHARPIGGFRRGQYPTLGTVSMP